MRPSHIIITLLLVLPLVFTPLLAGAGEDGTRKYHELSVAAIAAASVSRGLPTHVRTAGIVRSSRRERDGDRHISLCSADRAACIMLECIPQHPCPRVRRGQQVLVEGITRFDYAHRWWEVHPVESLRIISCGSAASREAPFVSRKDIAVSLCH